MVELLIRLDGSATTNRIAAFELPIVSKVGSSEFDDEGIVEFETKELVKAIRKALDKMQ